MARRIDQVLIEEGIAINTVGALHVQDASSIVESAFYVQFQGGANAGVVKIETAIDPDYAGTWAVLATITFAADAAVQYAALTGILRTVRARISTAIGGGGSVTVRMVGNQS